MCLTFGVASVISESHDPPGSPILTGSASRHASIHASGQRLIDTADGLGVRPQRKGIGYVGGASGVKRVCLSQGDTV